MRAQEPSASLVQGKEFELRLRCEIRARSRRADAQMGAEDGSRRANRKSLRGLWDPTLYVGAFVFGNGERKRGGIVSVRLSSIGDVEGYDD